ncbi:MAG: hypothetical protein LBI79_08345 [Nitrososphaerota archaeon]|jgi:hypothetical protein|nr:hypothetical protein [Nitrososphaerota archaeon]
MEQTTFYSYDNRKTKQTFATQTVDVLIHNLYDGVRSGRGGLQELLDHFRLRQYRYMSTSLNAPFTRTLGNPLDIIR